jgi:hypothetical protein
MVNAGKALDAFLDAKRASQGEGLIKLQDSAIKAAEDALKAEWSVYNEEVRFWGPKQADPQGIYAALSLLRRAENTTYLGRAENAADYVHRLGRETNEGKRDGKARSAYEKAVKENLALWEKATDDTVKKGDKAIANHAGEQEFRRLELESGICQVGLHNARGFMEAIAPGSFPRLDSWDEPADWQDEVQALDQRYKALQADEAAFKKIAKPGTPTLQGQDQAADKAKGSSKPAEVAKSKLTVEAARKNLDAARRFFDIARKKAKDNGSEENVKEVLKRGDELNEAADAYVQSSQEAQTAARDTGDKVKTEAAEKIFEQAIQDQSGAKQLAWDATQGRY